MHSDLSFISLNIEGRRHLDRILPFLEEQQPDVLCVQELNEHDITSFEEVLGARSVFAPMVCNDEDGGDAGVGIFSVLPFSSKVHWYAGNCDELCEFDTTNYETMYRSQHFQVVVTTLKKEESEYTIATTHFPVTAEGVATDFQRDALARLLAVLDEYDEMVLCGDFNAPRGREIFDTIAAKYIDNIPAEYTSSIDGDMHRAGPIPFMVDGLFTTPAYTASQVTLTSGVSDHCAISATISRK